MLTKWLRTRTCRSPQSDRFFRPQLEALEGRLAPSNVVPMHGHGNGNGNGNGNGHGNGNGGGPPTAPISGPVVNNSGNIHNNIHNNIHINNSFNDSFNALWPGVAFLGPTQQSSVGGLVALSSVLALEMSSSNLGGLISNEVALAVDKYLVSQPAIMAFPTLLNTLNADINTLNADIAANPLESTPIAQVIGMLAYDVTYNALTGA